MFFKKEYIANRDQICAGILTYRHKPDDFSTTVSAEKNTKDSLICRKILFTIQDTCSLAFDLIHNESSFYEIKGVTESQRPYGFIVDHLVKISTILEIMGYSERLTKADLNKIMKTILNDMTWMRYNLHLFEPQENIFGMPVFNPFFEGNVEDVYLSLKKIITLKTFKPTKLEIQNR